LLHRHVRNMLRPQKMLEGKGLLLAGAVRCWGGNLLRREPGRQVRKRAGRSHHKALRPHALYDLRDQVCA